MLFLWKYPVFYFKFCRVCVFDGVFVTTLGFAGGANHGWHVLPSHRAHHWNIFRGWPDVECGWYHGVYIYAYHPFSSRVLLRCYVLPSVLLFLTNSDAIGTDCGPAHVEQYSVRYCFCTFWRCHIQCLLQYRVASCVVILI